MAGTKAPRRKGLKKANAAKEKQNFIPGTEPKPKSREFTELLSRE